VLSTIRLGFTLRVYTYGFYKSWLNFIEKFLIAKSDLIKTKKGNFKIAFWGVIEKIIFLILIL
jgi:hypothetical protein